MWNEKMPPVLARLEMGFHTDAVRLNALDAEWRETLRRTQVFGKKHGIPDVREGKWELQLDVVDGILRRISLLVFEMNEAVESCDSEHRAQAMKAWETIQAEDAKSVEALMVLRAQVMGVSEASRSDWNKLARSLEAHFEAIYACAQALRIKLELLKEYSREEVDQLLRGVLSKLPSKNQMNGLDDERYAQEYHKAVVELEQEREKYLGFTDVLKGLFMWVETPEERMRKNLAITDKKFLFAYAWGEGPNQHCALIVLVGVESDSQDCKRAAYRVGSSFHQ